MGLYIWETILSETLTKMNAKLPIDKIGFAVSCSAIVTDEFELQLTKTSDKARNWMTMFKNWSTKDEIETSIRTFQSVRDEIENTFFKIEWRGDDFETENCNSPRLAYYYTVHLWSWHSKIFHMNNISWNCTKSSCQPQ